MTRRWLAAIATLGFVVIVVLPAAVMLAQSFLENGRPTFAHLATVLTGSRQWALLGNTLLLGFGGALGALALGIPTGFLVSRSDVPARGFFAAATVGPLLLPPLVHAIAWVGMTRMRGGLAAIAVFSLATFPLVSFLAARAFERIDARSEEAALLAGGPRARRRIAFRAALPSALVGAVAAFIFAVSDFSVPDFLSSVGPKLNVYADEIFTRWQREGSVGPAMAAALPPAALALAALVAVAGLRRRGAAVSVGGGFTPPETVRLGIWRAPALLFLAAVTALGVGAPLAYFAIGSGSLATIQQALGQARGEVLQSLASATAAGLVAAVLALAMAYLAARSRPSVARAVEAGALAPFAIPAVALSVALIRIWNHDGFPSLVYTGPGIVVLAFVARSFALAYLSASSGVAQLDPAMEESARLAGASFPRTFLSIVARLCAPSVATAFVLVFVFSMRELDVIVLIPAGNRSITLRIYNAIHFNRPQFVAALCLVLSFLTVLPLVLYRLALGRRLEAFA